MKQNERRWQEQETEGGEKVLSLGRKKGFKTGRKAEPTGGNKVNFQRCPWTTQDDFVLAIRLTRFSGSSPQNTSFVASSMCKVQKLSKPPRLP